MSDRLLPLRLVLGLATVVFTLSVLSHEPPSGLLIHLPFEGSVENVGRAHVMPEVISSDMAGGQGSLSYATGYPGQAAVFGGDSAVRIPFDLHPDFYPQLTVAMWIKAGAGLGSGFLFSTGAPSGAKLQFAKGQVTALGPRVQTRVSYTPATDQWILIAGVWDYQAGSVAVFANGEMTAVGFDAGQRRDHNFARADFWLGTYDDRAGSTNTVSGIHIDEVRIYDRALSQEELLGMAIGPPIEEEPQLGDPPLPPEEESEPHEPPLDATGSDPDPRDEMHQDRSDSDDSGTLPGEDPMLDKLRRTQAPGGHHSDDVVRDTVGEQYEPGPTTDWEEVQREAKRIDDEELEEARRSVGDELNPGGDRLTDAVRDQVSDDEIPDSTDFETRRQGLEEEPASVSGRGRAGVAGTLEVTPMKDGELYVRIKAGEGTVSAWSDNATWGEEDVIVSMDLEDQAIHTIEWFEEGDQPCKLVVYGYAPGTNQFGAPNSVSFGRDLCRNSANERSRKAVSVARHNAVIVALREGEAGKSPLSSTFAGGTKAIEVRGEILTADGDLTGETVLASAKRANFGSWAEWTRCPKAHVATGVRVKLRMAYYSLPQIFDLALICREVEG